MKRLMLDEQNEELMIKALDFAVRQAGLAGKPFIDLAERIRATEADETTAAGRATSKQTTDTVV